MTPAAKPGRNTVYRNVCPDAATRGRLLRAIKNAIRRCQNPACKHYDRYGGRGIAVLPAWAKSRAAFLAYLTSLPGHDDPSLELDRVDNDCGYEPGNLRFTSAVENTRNRGWSLRAWGTGVVFDKNRGRWLARFQARGQKYDLGCFATRDEALAIANAKRIELGLSIPEGK